MSRLRIPLKTVLAAVILLISLAGRPESAYALDARDTVFTYLTDTVELTPAAACGIMANIDKESAFRADIWGGGGAYGLCQWTGIRRSNLVNYCASIGYGSGTVEGQVRFLYYELQTVFPEVLSYLRSVENTAAGAYNAAYYYCYYYERPYNAYAVGVNRGNHAQTVIWPLYGANACFLRASDEEAGIQLTWGGSTQSVCLIYRSSEKNGTYKKIGTKAENSPNQFVDKNAKSGSTYHYLVVIKAADEDDVKKFAGIGGCQAKHSNDVSCLRRCWITAEEAVITLKQDEYTYTGNEIMPQPVVSFGTETLIAGTDYTVSYQNNIDTGTASMTISGKGDHPGERTVAFKIRKAQQKISVPVRKVNYQDEPIAFDVSAQGDVTAVSSDKSVAYFRNGKLITRKCGMIKLTVNAAKTRNYKAASKTVKIIIAPSSPVISNVKAKKVSSSKDDIKIRFSCGGEPTGYIVQYTQKGVFTDGNKIRIKNGQKVSCVISALKRQNGRLYRMCAYVKIGKKYYFSKWSEAKTVSSFL